MSRKDGYSKKKIALEYDSSWAIWKDGIFFLENIMFFSLDEKWKMIFLKKHMEIWFFLYIYINVTNMTLPFCKKDQRWSSSEKIHLKVIDILDRILERVATLLCTSMETFSCIAFHWKKKQKKTGNLIYRMEIWLLLKFIWLEIFYNEKSLLLCIIQPSGVVFRGVLEHQLRKLFVH